jgi:hypothetical protein
VITFFIPAKNSNGSDFSEPHLDQNDHLLSPSKPSIARKVLIPHATKAIALNATSPNEIHNTKSLFNPLKGTSQNLAPLVLRGSQLYFFT